MRDAGPLVIVVEESVTTRERCVVAIKEAGFDVLSAVNIDEAMTLIDLLPAGGAMVGIVVGTISGRGLISFVKNRLAISDLHVEEHASLASAVGALEARSAADVPPSSPIVYKVYSTHDLLQGRPEELELMFTHFLLAYSRLHGRNLNGYSDAAMDRLCSYGWPGGVRQIRDVVMTLVEASTTPQITLRELAGLEDADLLTFTTPLGLTIKALNRRYALLVLERVGGNKSEAARILGIGIKTLQRWMTQWSDGGASEDETEGGAAGP